MSAIDAEIKRVDAEIKRVAAEFDARAAEEGPEVRPHDMLIDHWVYRSCRLGSSLPHFCRSCAEVRLGWTESPA